MKDSFLKLENLAEETEVESYQSYNPVSSGQNGTEISRLIVTLHPESEGYSVSVYSREHPEFAFDTGIIPYDEYEFLECIDNRELPFMVLDILDDLGINLFINGTLNTEVRDCRINPDPETCQKEYVVLKPTLQSVIHEIAMCCGDDFTEERKSRIESRLLNALSGPLNLEVRRAASYDSEEVEDDESEVELKKPRLSDIRYSLIKKQRMEFKAPVGLNLYDFLRKRKENKSATSAQRHHHRRKEQLPPYWQENPSEIVPPKEVVDVTQFAKALERPPEITDSALIPLEEYIFEADKGPQGQGRIYLVRLTILHRRATDEFVGELYVDRDFKENNPSSGSLCRFPLGPRNMVNKYIHQFTEIFTEEGRKSVKITHNMPNQPPRVMCTFAMKEQKVKQEQALQQQQQASAQPATPTGAGTVQETAQSANSVAPPNVTVTQSGEIPPMTSSTQQRAGQPLTRQALIDNLKSGQLTPPISALLTSLINSGQLQRTPSGGLAIAKQPNQGVNTTEGVRILLPQGSAPIQGQQQIVQQQGVAVANRGMAPRVPRPANLASLLATRNASLTDQLRGQRPGSPGSPRLVTAGSPRPLTAHSPMIRTPATPNRSDDVVMAIDPPVTTDGVNTMIISKQTKQELPSPVMQSQQQNATLTSLLAGSPHSVAPDPSSVLERLSSPPSVTSRVQAGSSMLSPRAIAPAPIPLGSGQRIAMAKRPPTIVQHGVTSGPSDSNVVTLQDVGGGNLQNVQVSIPGLSMPLSLQIAMPEDGSAPTIQDHQGQTMVLQQQQQVGQRITASQLQGAIPTTQIQQIKTGQGNQTTVLLVGPRPGNGGQTQQSISLPVSLLQLPKSQAQATRPVGQIRTSLIRQPQPGSSPRPISSQNLTTHQQLQLALQRHAQKQHQQRNAEQQQPKQS